MTGAAEHSGPTVLALDAVGEACEVALLGADGAVFERREPMAKGHAERLFPLIQEVLADAGVAAAQVDLFAAARGPGSFTGVRIGVAAARGLALAAGATAVGIDGFVALASSAQTAGVRARRAAVVFGKPPRLVARVLELDDIGARALGHTAPFDALCSSDTGPDLLLGPGAEAGRRQMIAVGKDELALDARFSHVGAALVARLAATSDPAVGPPAPIYLRPPDAEPSRELRPARLGPRPI